jgi:Phorbol esters/diacylglycerol binding domain (C1 domain)
VTKDRKCHTPSKVHLSPFLPSVAIARCVVFYDLMDPGLLLIPCKTSIWGLSKQGKTCKLCGLSVHSKCELKVILYISPHWRSLMVYPKVPAECTGSSGTHQGSVASVARTSTRRRPLICLSLFVNCIRFHKVQEHQTLPPALQDHHLFSLILLLMSRIHTRLPR